MKRYEDKTANTNNITTTYYSKSNETVQNPDNYDPTKFLINRDGEVVDRFASSYSMTKVKQAIEAELEK